MPTFRDCIKTGLANKEITKLQADVAIAFADETEKGLQRAAGELDIDGQLATLFERQQVNAKRQAAMETLKFQEVMKNIEKIAKAKGITGKPRGFGAGVKTILARDQLETADFGNVDVRTLALQRRAYAPLSGRVAEVLPSKVGARESNALLERVMLELHLDNSGSPQAKSLAAIFRDIFEGGRLGFNRAGGMILPRKKWGFGHLHNPAKIKRVPYAEWSKFQRDLIDWKETTDALGIPHTPEAIERMMARAYENITGYGVPDIKAAQRGSKKIANRHQEHRSFIYKDGAAWLTYNKRFGNPDLWQAIQHHINGMARETALMEILGPNPFAMMRQLRSISEQVDPGKATGILGFDAIWNVVTGKTSTVAPHAYSANLAAIGQGTRDLLGVALLGRATVTSFTDLHSIRMTKAFNGTKSSFILKEVLADMVGLRAEANTLAMKNGLSALGSLEASHGAMRFTDQMGFGWTSKLADKFHRITLLTPWTNSGQETWGREMGFTMGGLTQTPWGKLDAPLRRAFQRHGIDEAGWIAAKNATSELPNGKGLKMFDPFKIDDDSIAIKFQEMFVVEMDKAVPMPDARVRAIITGGRQKGDVMGEIIRSVGLFKSFPITMMLVHGGRSLSRENPSRTRYFATLLAGYASMGAVVVQMKHVLRGEDLESMATSQFWIKAMLQGGALGFFGDVMFGESSQWGIGPIESTLGPVPQFLDDMGNLTLGAFNKVIRGEADDVNFWTQFNRFRRKYLTPKPWYAELMLERMLFDQLTEDANPNAAKIFQQMDKRLKRQTGQERFWRPGDALPNRVPDLGKAFERPDIPPRRPRRERGVRF